MTNNYIEKQIDKCYENKSKCTKEHRSLQVLKQFEFQL